VDKPYKCQIIQQIEIIVQKIMHFHIHVANANANCFKVHTTPPYKPLEMRGSPSYLITLVLIDCDFVVKFKEINHKHSYIYALL
jgi:hypothetical protein